MLRAFEARIRAIRSTAGRYRDWVEEDGISLTGWWILYRKIVPDEVRLAQVTRGVDPRAEVLRVLRRDH